jgi:hypothetical protein
LVGAATLKLWLGGTRARIAAETGLMREAGMMLPGNGVRPASLTIGLLPVAGS